MSFLFALKSTMKTCKGTSWSMDVMRKELRLGCKVKSQGGMAQALTRVLWSSIFFIADSVVSGNLMIWKASSFGRLGALQHSEKVSNKYYARLLHLQGNYFADATRAKIKSSPFSLRNEENRRAGWPTSDLDISVCGCV